jgi:vacuolar fusion protein MON1
MATAIGSGSGTSPISIPSAHLQGQGAASDSLASSLSNNNGETNEGILIQEVEVEVDTVDGEEGNAVGHVDSLAGDESSKRSLRDKLRRTLSKKQANAGEWRPWMSLLNESTNFF